MSEDKDDVRSGFVRQRRNLIVTSLVLLFALIHQVKPIQTLHMPGTPIEFARPVAVVPYLVIVFLYFAGRYYVYFRDIGDKGFMPRFRARLSYLARRYFEKLFRSDDKLREQLRLKSDEHLVSHVYRFNSGETVRAEDAVWMLRDAQVVGALDSRGLTVELSYVCKASRAGQEIHLKEDRRRAEIRGQSAAKIYVRAGLYVLVHSRILSEYFLPFVIAALPVVYAIYKMCWHGNL